MAKCMFPFYVERKFYLNQEDRLVPVPCGKCPECLKRRVASWSFRLEREALSWSKQFFVTLTYAVPPISTNGFMSLDKSHPQLFFKNLRHHGKFKYYLCGEYGTQFKRPHYHVILLCDSSITEESISACWMDFSVSPRVSRGHVYFGKVESASIKYTVQYYDKGDWYPSHQNDDRLPEFSLMSKGLGKSWITPETRQYILSNPERQFLYTKGGGKMAIPSYFKRRIFDYPGTYKLVSNHPSWLIHRDEMLQIKKERMIIIKRIQDEKEQPEQSRELHESRKAAISSYRNSKRKTRDTF
nr:MAG: replication initiator protein [Microvirus sp.]